MNPVGLNQLQQQGLAKLERWNLAQKVSTIAILVIIGATIAFIGLTMAGKIHGAIPIATFAGIAPLTLSLIFIDKCKKSVVRSHGLPRETLHPPSSSSSNSVASQDSSVS